MFETRPPPQPVPPPGPPPVLGDLRMGGNDDAGYPIIDIYARKPPDYVVYRTCQKVAIQYADLPEAAAPRRKIMAALNPLRGEINGLIDGWRLRERQSGAGRRAERYDRRVADALIVALEGDVASGLAHLQAIKQDIFNERVAWARFQYLMVALAAGIVGTLTAYGLVRWGGFPHVSDDLYQAAGAGLIGAFFSIALAIRSRTVLPDLQWLANAMDAALRMLVGLISAGVLVAMVDAHMVNVTFGLPEAPAPGGQTPPPAPAPAADAKLDCGIARCSDDAWLKILIFGFVAGFSERFVPDLLAKASATAPAPDPAPAAEEEHAAGKKPEEDAGKPEGEQGAEAAPAAGGDIDPHEDHCVCGMNWDGADPTADEHLPAASGGVAAPGPAQGE